MTRRLLNLLTGLSLLLCVAVCVLWVRSYRAEDELPFRSGRSLLFSNRWLGIGYRTADGVSPRTSGQRGLDRFGFGWYWMYYRTGDVVFTACGPHSFFALLTAALPALWIVTRRRRGLRRAGNRCARCEYDLTGNESGVCPECGKPVFASAST